MLEMVAASVFCLRIAEGEVQPVCVGERTNSLRYSWLNMGQRETVSERESASCERESSGILSILSWDASGKAAM